MKIARPKGAIAPRQATQREGPSLFLSGKAAAFNRYDGGLGRFAVAKASKFRTENDVPKVTYIAFNGAAHAVDVPVGRSLMEGAVGNNVPGIDGDCGGAAACATCHIYVSPDWQAKMQPRSTLETDMLDCAEDVSGDSRLSCQIAMSEALDGLVVRLPATQR